MALGWGKRILQLTLDVLAILCNVLKMGFYCKLFKNTYLEHKLGHDVQVVHRLIRCVGEFRTSDLHVNSKLDNVPVDEQRSDRSPPRFGPALGVRRGKLQ